jgi:uncharacterized protein YndB with AHSA1/START domain
VPVKNESKNDSRCTIVTESGSPVFILTRLFDAPRELVFRAWTEPQHVARWWGPRGMTTPVRQMDVRPGGAYRIVMRSPEGVDYPMKGIYREVVRPERIVYTADLSEHPREWHDLVNPDRRKDEPFKEILNTITFEQQGGKTKVTIRMDFESEARRDSYAKLGMSQGWSQSLEKLDELLVDENSTADREIRMSRVFDAPRELVFEAWTDSKHLANWWGPKGFTLTTQKMDFRPGGVWQFIMHGPDGVDYPNKDVYIEIVKPLRIVLEHASGPIFTMTAIFTEENGKTRLDIQLLFRTPGERDKTVKTFNAVEGLKETLGRLAQYLATRSK